MSTSFALLLLMIFFIFMGGYTHESDLIDQCYEDGKMELWHSGYELTCKINKTGE